MRRILHRVRALLRKEKLDTDMSEEMRLHLELQAERNIARGMDPNEARYAARREFGGVEQIKERCRDLRRWQWVEECVKDVRYGTRMLRRNPGFTTVVTLTLALGIGINTAVFSFYGAVVLKPLAVREPEQIVRVVSWHNEGWDDLFTYGEFEDLARRTRSFSDVIATSPQHVMQVIKSGPIAGVPETFGVRLVSPNYFFALGVQPHLGRVPGVTDPAAGVLSYESWQRRFHGDPTIIGRTLRVQNVVLTIVGVAAKSFAGTGRSAAVPDLWLPLALQPALLPAVDWLHNPESHAWQMLARRRVGVRLEQAMAELGVLGTAWKGPDGKVPKIGAIKATLFQVDYPEFHAVCAVLMVAVGLVLFIGGVNIVNLLAARNVAREHEFALRRSLGASRSRLVRQLCTESILLGIIGGVGGLTLSVWLCEILRAWLGAMAQRLTAGAQSLYLDVSPDWHVLAYAVVVSVITGLAVGLWPALRAMRASLNEQLKQGGSGASIIGGTRRQRNLPLAIQVAACLILLSSAGLLFRGAAQALTIDPRFDAKRVFVLWIDPTAAAPGQDARLQLLGRVKARLMELPQIDDVAWAERGPFMGHRISPFETDDGKWVPGCVVNRGTEDYFATLGLTVVKGRSFTKAEVEANAPVVVISELAARHLWPGKDPLGRRLFYSKRAHGGRRDSLVVVGVTRDARLTLLSQTDAVDLFVPASIAEGGVFLVRTRGAPDSAFQSTLAALRSVEATLPTQAIMMSMEEGPMLFQRLWAMAPATFASVVGGIALLLASVGIYGLVSFMVVRRTREIGVRIALGAQGRTIVRLMLHQTLQPVVWGALLGFAGALVMSVVIARLVLNPEFPDLTYGAGAVPSATLVGVSGLLFVVILLAALVPARRAAKVDPAVALRCD